MARGKDEVEACRRKERKSVLTDKELPLSSHRLVLEGW